MSVETLPVPNTAHEWFPNFDAFMVSRLPALTRIAQHILVNIDDAQDAVADVLPVVARKFKRISKLDNPDAYVTTMVKNRCFSYRKRAVARSERPCDPAQIPEQMTRSEGAHGRREEIARSLMRLSPKQRLAVYLRYYEHKTYPEIALELRIKEATVRGYVSEAYSHLREMLGAETEGGK